MQGHDPRVAQQDVVHVPVVVRVPHLVDQGVVAQDPGVPLEQPVVVAAEVGGPQPEVRHVAGIVVQVDRVAPLQLLQQPRRVVRDPGRQRRQGREEGDPAPRSASALERTGVRRLGGVLAGSARPGPVGRLLPGEAPGLDHGPLAELTRPARVVEQPDQLGRQLAGIGDVEQQPRVADDLDLRRVVAGDHRRPAVHRLEDRAARTLRTIDGKTNAAHADTETRNALSESQSVITN